MQGIIFAPARLTARVLGSVSNNQSTCSWHSQRENWVSSLFLPLIGARAAVAERSRGKTASLSLDTHSSYPPLAPRSSLSLS